MTTRTGRLAYQAPTAVEQFEINRLLLLFGLEVGLIVPLVLCRGGLAVQFHLSEERKPLFSRALRIFLAFLKAPNLSTFAMSGVPLSTWG